MKVGALKESFEGEARVAVTPSSAGHLMKLGHEVFVESGAGARAGFSDDSYRAAGVTVVPSAAELIRSVDVVAKVRQPSESEIGQMQPGQTLISFFYPAQNSELLAQACDIYRINSRRGVTVIVVTLGTMMVKTLQD